MLKRLLLTLAVLIGISIVPAGAIAPPAPGSEMPQSIIDLYQAEPDRFLPTPALTVTMQRYANLRQEAARWGYDDTDDVNGYFPVVCGKYSNSGGDDWPISQMQTQLFDGPWPTGTMRDYYHEISFDEFHLNGQVYGWYTSTMTQAYVTGSNYGMGGDAHVGEFLFELLNWTDPSVDFGQYDNDGPDGEPNSGDDDGTVDTIFFIHDGAGGETGANNIWSHSSNLWWAAGSMFYTDDLSENGGVISIGPYIIQPSINSGGGMIEIGVFCHEFGHALGLPDLYDTDYSSEGIGIWGLMSGGSWNTPAKPAHMIAWCLEQMGWIDPVEVNDFLHDQPITPIALTGEAYKLWTNGNYGNQYFMIENRQRYGTDINLVSEGLMVYHVDNSAQQSNEDHPKVAVEQADGLNNLYYGSNGGDPGDPFPGSSDNHWFDEFSNPSSNDYYGQTTQVAVWDISDEADTMYANLDVIYSQPMLDYVGYEMDDSSGDDDGRADPGETVDLWITVNNYWAEAANLIGFIDTNSEYVTIDDATGVFGTVPSQTLGSNQSSPFVVTVDGEAPHGQWVTFDVHMAAEGGYEQDFTFQMMIGVAPIVVVDDDMGESYEEYITGSLDEMYALYEVYDMNTAGTSADISTDHELIIWITGDDASHTLTNDDIAFLENFIDNGGALILSGQNINEDIGYTSFFQDYLLCETNSQTVGSLSLNGVTGNPISEGMSVLLIGTTGAGNQSSPSSVIPQGNAQAMFEYPNGEIGAISYANPVTQSHVVYLAFGLEAVSGLGGTTTRTDFLSTVFEWAEMFVEVGNTVPNLAPDDFTL
ncbi:MAG: M6 family metalloprotease domain-containing protein, partial [FCB group bacterium]|nr:M6 family metalloprotease domain-containing protein [FCB group bacterium]